MTAPATPALRLVEADRNAALARQRLSATVGELQARLDPSRLADMALAEVQAVGSASVAAAEQHRGALLGAGAALGLFFVRGPLLRLFRSPSKPKAQSAATPALLPPATAPDAPR
jgi:hypothetical protein